MNFEKHWIKLNFPIYHTIRSPDYMKTHNLEINRLEKVKIKGIYNHNALVLAYTIKKIIDIPLSFLQYDVLPIQIQDHNDFVDIMNELVLKYKGYQGKNTITSKKSIIWFLNKGYF